MSYQTYAKIRDARGLRDADVIKATRNSNYAMRIQWHTMAYKPHKSRL